MKNVLLASAGFLALGLAPALSADLPNRMVTKAPSYVVAPLYNWTGMYVGGYAGGGFGGDAAFGGAGRFETSGGVAGGTLGYNWQAGNIVYGIEGDFGYSNIGGTGGCGLVGGCAVRNEYLGTVRGRVGYAGWDRWLPFVSGGFAYGNIRTNSILGQRDFDKGGYALGGGVEYALSGPWTAKVEYLYVDLGNIGATPLTGGTNREFNTNIVRAGLNYRF